MTVSVSHEDLEALAAALEAVRGAAADLERELRARGEASRTEGAAEVGAIAASLAARARSGELGGQAGALPLSRPFGEWDYGSAAGPVWQRIDAADRIWDERLGGGDFEVAP